VLSSPSLPLNSWKISNPEMKIQIEKSFATQRPQYFYTLPASNTVYTRTTSKNIFFAIIVVTKIKGNISSVATNLNISLCDSE
jgi:hypothetical protein